MKKMNGWSEEDLLRYRFANIKGIGLTSRLKLLDRFGDIRSVWKAGETDLKDLLSEKQIYRLVKAREDDDPEPTIRRLTESGTRFIHMNHRDYPEKLRHIYMPPTELYVRGKLPSADRPCLAMVGSRRATNYGKGLARDYAGILAACGVQIISGLAAGIDTESHIGALKAGGYTAAVLGGGIDSVYPRKNFHLYQEMYARGGVISEYNIGIPNSSGLFPMRNRIISGLSDGVFVLEAAGRSGSLITANLGLDQGKDIFALPGRVTDAMSKGCNELIAQGAIPVNRPEDILDVLFSYRGYEGSKGDRQHTAAGTDAIASDRENKLPAGDEAVEETDSDRENKLLTMDEAVEETDIGRENQAVTGYDEDTILVLQMIDAVDAVSFETLASESLVERKRLEFLLFTMEINGLIYQPVQGLYLRTVG